MNAAMPPASMTHSSAGEEVVGDMPKRTSPLILVHAG